MTSTSAPRCPLCGAEMREDLGMEREFFGCVERSWMCPRCLHRTTTEDVRGAGEVPAPGETKEDRWQTR
ncbi:hypothetical protein DW090_01650 [Olsenella sp. AM05-17]|uniref:hypothetical protein n=1 Tax=unclassified Olsenella TaxID=2638792 RepID=UPI000E51A4D5|nr:MULTISPECIES: hypothetical protein [unclassified Olsenella]RHJ96104.1 hypothetical protein DW092_00475 [Olsenella sp. AM05-7]RHK00463.1 hypothetical protein DW090_01650 [Olsenella sp. AM05-17]